MNKYPTLAELAHPFAPETFVAFGYDETERSRIATQSGLAELCICDQYARAKAELGVSSVEQGDRVQNEIWLALLQFQFRGFSSGEAPSSSDLKRAFRKIWESADEIETALDLIFSARRDLVSSGDPRAEALRQLHTAILDVIANDALPTLLVEKFTLDDIADNMPETDRFPNFSNPWTGNFHRVARKVERLSEAFSASDFSKSFKRTTPQEFVDFVHRLATIYREVTGKQAAANKPSATQAPDWKSPFVRFLCEVWPLTPEGSTGRDVPNRARIQRALKATPSF